MARFLIRLMRLQDWAKNVFVLIAPIFALPLLLGRAGTTPLLPREPNLVRMGLNTLLTFLAFCMLSSAFYAINDVLDAESDRRHPVKCRRPVASGALAPRVATIFGLILMVAGLGLGFMANPAVGFICCLYVLLQIGYNLGLNRVLVVDVVTVAVGFSLRAAAGAAAIEVLISVWLVLCILFLCLYLGFIKRLCDIASAAAAGGEGWRPQAGYGNRAELNWLLGLSAVLTVVTYLMYSLTYANWIFGPRSIGFAIMTPFVLIVIHRFYHRANAGLSDSPLAALREDRAVLLGILIFTIGIIATLYVPWVEKVIKMSFVTSGAGAVP